MAKPSVDYQISLGALLIDELLRTLPFHPDYKADEKKSPKENSMIPLHHTIKKIWDSLYELFGTERIYSGGQGIVHSSWQRCGIYANLPVDPNIWEELAMILDWQNINVILDAGAGRAFFTALLKYSLKSNYKIFAYDILDIDSPFMNVYKFNELEQRLLLKSTRRNCLLILLWPEYRSLMAEATLRRFKGDNVLIASNNFSPGRASCATPQFFRKLKNKWQPLRVWQLHSTDITDNVLVWFTKKLIY
ncbi:MAG: hypothetical protein Harvfovirus5_27 [Harvfovirus sp.]|uniref:Uncharacterized protein n=1 Tax=Harvfovirus sp. TaxID=2487768 RepID=A0A3G5A4H1_9VIRU|nr:MAG: hypothetical protein Harvfovirus5_27 [Harvfovirus sp.]